jgi:hypothetical protein
MSRIDAKGKKARLWDEALVALDIGEAYESTVSRHRHRWYGASRQRSGARLAGKIHVKSAHSELSASR